MVKKAAIGKSNWVTLGNLLPLSGGYQVQFFYDFRQIPSSWDKVAPHSNVFLQKSYLSVLQEFAPDDMQFCYCLFYGPNAQLKRPNIYKDTQPIGLAIFQIQHFKADSSIIKKSDNATPCFFSAVAQGLRKLLARRVEFNTLVCGNLLLTGRHGFYFLPSAFPNNNGKGNKVAFEVIRETMELAKVELEKKGSPISVFLVKDFEDKYRPAAKNLLSQEFNEFTIQPNMVLPIRKEWTNFEDYLNSFQSKYRVRARRAFKKGNDLQKRELSLSEIEQSIDLLYKLYDQVVENANFNVVRLHKNYFLGLKRNLGNQFKLIGYFLNGRLVGFYTLIENGTDLEAHFLGIEQSVNKTYQVYLNMLYDMVRTGIETEFEQVVLSRTALEIKSSVGAIPVEMYCYMRHKNSFPNKWANTIFEYLRPKQDWVQRHPFK